MIIKSLSIAAIPAVLLSLTGCVANQPKLSSEVQYELDRALYCQTEDDCKAMWERATYYVSTHAGYKMQIVSDTVIETHNPTQHSTALAFKVTKEPVGTGQYRLWTTAWCANMFGCVPNKFEAIAKAKYYIRTGEMM